jgi:hypothetical protein
VVPRGQLSLIRCGPILGGFNTVTMQTYQGTDTVTGGKIVASNDQIWIAGVLLGREPTSARNGGIACQAVRSASYIR